LYQTMITVSWQVRLMPRLRFRALIALDPAGTRPNIPLRPAAEEYPNHTRTLVVRVPSFRVPGHSWFFPAEICWDSGQALHPGDHAVVTIAVANDGAGELLDAGRHFALWRGGDVGSGVISRRVYTDYGPS
jgi:hypothetical protein